MEIEIKALSDYDDVLTRWKIQGETPSEAIYLLIQTVQKEADRMPNARTLQIHVKRSWFSRGRLTHSRPFMVKETRRQFQRGENLGTALLKDQIDVPVDIYDSMTDKIYWMVQRPWGRYLLSKFVKLGLGIHLDWRNQYEMMDYFGFPR